MGPMSLVPCSTQEMIGSFPTWESVPSLLPGPVWKSFEGFRTAGVAALSQIPEHGVGTLHTKSGSYRILREADFLSLVGKASEVNRIQRGFRYIKHALEVWKNHPDEKHAELVMEFTSFMAGSPSLPEQVGHERFSLPVHGSSTEEPQDDFDILQDEIPTPELS